ncbi:hypothetical protein J6590_088633 [Homalodisca vitripennis]|nr:hypothetical protein J6590_088633 [Homalodisca vitripennis]
MEKCKSSRDFWAKIRTSGVTDPFDPAIPNFVKDLEEINKYFVSMGLRIMANDDCVQFYERNKSESVTCDFYFRSVTRREVQVALNSITSEAVGADGISIKMIKMISPYCIDAITHLANQSLATSTFPDACATSCRGDRKRTPSRGIITVDPPLDSLYPKPNQL